MVTRSKVVKKKVTKTTASQNSAAGGTSTVASSVPKKKGVAVKRQQKESVPSVFALGESLVISEVTEMREKMAKAITGQEVVVLDGGEIEQIDGAGLQLLVSLMKQAVNAHSSVSWKSASDVLLDGAAQLGLTEVLGLEKLSGAN